MATAGTRVTVTTSPTRLDIDQTDLAEAVALLVRNRGSATVDLGGDTVASGAGFRLDAGETVSVRAESYEVGVYAVAATGTVTVDVLQVGV